MIQQDLNVTLRTEMGKKSIARSLRNKGYVPAICYGALKESIPVYVSAKELKLALSTEAKEHVLLNLKTDNKSELNKKIAILKDISKHPTRRDYIHADFQVLDMSKPIKVTVDIRLIGKAEGVKMGGIIDQVRRAVDIKCLPTDIPSHIDIDITNLGLNESLHVSDIEAIEGVEIVTSGNLTIANLAEPAKAKLEEEIEGEEIEEKEAAGEEAEGKEAEGEEAAE